MFSKTIIPGTFAVLALLGHWASATAAPSPPPYFLTIQLDTRADQAPDHVCLVSSFQHPEWNTKHSDETLGPHDPVSNTKQSDETLGPDDASLPLEWIRPIAVPAEDRTTWKFDASSQTKLDASPGPWLSDIDMMIPHHANLRIARPHIKAALAAMVFDVGTTNPCTNPGEACRPSFEILPYIANIVRGQDKLHIACTPNARPTHRADKRVLVIFLNTHSGVHPRARTIMLDGNVVTVRLEGSIPESEVFIASVLGGHYFPGETATSFDRRIVLTPTPRCHETNIELVDYDARSEQTLAVKLTENKSELLTCRVQVINGYAKVSLPERSMTDPKILELRGPTSGLRFTATWSDRVPPATLRGALRGISLRWTRHCLYPRLETCPSAHLVDSGLDCSQGVPDEDGCSYTCDAEDANIPIHIPEVVQFTHAVTRDTWTGRVSYSGARVDTYLDSRDRKLLVSTPRRERSGSWRTLGSFMNPGVSEIDLLFPKGRSVTMPFDAGMHAIIDAPGIECNTKVVYHYIGMFVFDPDYVAIKDGAIALRDPGTLIFDKWRFFVDVGVGYESVQGQKTSFDHVTLNYGGGLRAIGAWDSWWFVDVFVDGSIGQREYYVQNSSGDRSLRSTGMTRSLGGVALGMYVRYLSASLGVETGTSNGRTDMDLLPVQAVLVPMLHLQAKISHNLSLMVSMHRYIGEERRIVDPARHLLGTEDRRSSSIEVGLAWTPAGTLFDRGAREKRDELDAH